MLLTRLVHFGTRLGIATVRDTSSFLIRSKDESRFGRGLRPIS
ncbi:MAG: hypothetical protein CEO22_560 [Candidatus Berkelbacteria bacterium Gr01-1014_85]|uniref:Uncharacterized protein n=1 Tax=Candidatus Berkelbacteria bacterium Gr01-1014_85 TaxID=2017150 RepID=A0A554JAB5_9BACT|nr:MAG: hypothetical protein CEO22_560 [Candidatus Berkelbacteria bacterium Gr01-1014_85]